MDINFTFKKSLGQHFLIDNNVVDSIISHSTNLHCLNVIEVGPGNGSLTKAILSKCKSLTAIETDKHLIPFLENIKKTHSNFHYLIKDARKIDFLKCSAKPQCIISNLPYNIGTYLFTKWLPISQYFNYFILMFQKEVALRITSNTNSTHYGRLALFTKLYGNAEILFTVGRNSFKPPPLVESAVIKFTPHKKALDINKDKFLEIVKTAFLKRRKTIRVSLKMYNLNFERIGIDSNSRPEQLTFNQFVLLSNYI